jgi:hypothetical protein
MLGSPVRIRRYPDSIGVTKRPVRTISRKGLRGGEIVGELIAHLVNLRRDSGKTPLVEKSLKL